MRILCAMLALVLTACNRADASTNNLVSLSVTYVQADSARIVATWKRPCDVRGCADLYRVQWSLGAALRIRNTSVLADTVLVARPAIGDSLIVSVSVNALRRGMSGVERTATTVIRNPDAPPPPVEELKADTLISPIAAETDSFPVIVARDTLGRSSGTYAVGNEFGVCALSRNRYTGEVRILVPADAPVEADTLLARVCERARQSYAAERAG